MSILARAVLAILLAGAIGGQARAEAPLFAANASSFMLDNGLEVVVIPDHRAPIVTHMVWYRAGSADDPPGKSGIAHFLEHLMFKGTEDHPEGEFSKVIRSVGGSENAFTSNDYTAYFQNVAKQHLATMMEYEADRMANLLLPEDEIVPERKVVIEERNSRIDNDPGAQLSEAVGATLFQNSGYGIPAIGWDHEIAQLERQDAIDFYDRFYTPNNAFVVVAGDVTEEEVRTLAEATYGKVERRSEAASQVRPAEPEPLAERSVTLKDPRVTQPVIQRAFVVPSYATATGREAAALDLLSDILSAGSTSRLFRELVVENPVAATAGAYYSGSALGDTRFVLYGVPRDDEVLLDDLMGEIDAIVADIAENGVTEEELDRARRRIRASTIYSLDNHSSLARIFGTALATGQTVEGVQSFFAGIEAVTPDDVAAVARRYFDPSRSVTGYLLGAPAENRS